MSAPGYIDGGQGDSGGRPIRVTVKDLETGDEEITELRNDYLLITVGRVYLASTQTYRNGTHVLTVKREAGDA